MDCPRCHGSKVRRSHRRSWWERVLSRMMVYPLRCDDCGARFFRHLSGKDIPGSH